MNYQRYVNLALFHDYYQQGICPDFTIEPTHTCQRILKGHRLLLKPTPNGLQLLIPVGVDQRPVLPLDGALAFTFLLKLKNPTFVNFTQLDSQYQPNQTLYVFTNETLDNASEPQGESKEATSTELASTLLQRQNITHPQSTRSPLEAYCAKLCAQIAELRSPNNQIFGVIEIRYRESWLNNLNRAMDFTISFTAKQQPWTYYLVTDKAAIPDSFSIQDKTSQDKAIQDKAIQDKNLADSNTVLQFSLVQSDNKVSDRILAGIRQRFPESQTILLRSNTAIACREIGRPNLQLFQKEPAKDQEKLWISNLPNPPNQHGAQVINLLTDL
jgi:hypothetical protein